MMNVRFGTLFAFKNPGKADYVTIGAGGASAQYKDEGFDTFKATLLATCPGVFVGRTHTYSDMFVSTGSGVQENDTAVLEAIRAYKGKSITVPTRDEDIAVSGQRQKVKGQKNMVFVLATTDTGLYFNTAGKDAITDGKRHAPPGQAEKAAKKRDKTEDAAPPPIKPSGPGTLNKGTGGGTRRGGHITG